jgi:hypothetical protein
MPAVTHGLVQAQPALATLPLERYEEDGSVRAHIRGVLKLHPYWVPGLGEIAPPRHDAAAASIDRASYTRESAFDFKIFGATGHPAVQIASVERGNQIVDD